MKGFVRGHEKQDKSERMRVEMLKNNRKIANYDTEYLSEFGAFVGFFYAFPLQ